MMAVGMRKNQFSSDVVPDRLYMLQRTVPHPPMHILAALSGLSGFLNKSRIGTIRREKRR